MMNSVILSLTALLLSVINDSCALPSISSNQPSSNDLHHKMSREELREVFSVDSADQVPEYHLVHVRSVQKRSLNGIGHEIHLNAFGEDKKLNLFRNPEINSKIRMFYVDTDKDDDKHIEIERVDGDVDMDVGELYQDVENDAALLVEHDNDDELQLNGVVGPYTVQPVPPQLKSLVPKQDDDDVLFLEDDDDGKSRQKRSTVLKGLHIIKKTEYASVTADAALLSEQSDITNEENIIENDSPFRHKRSTESLYPEVLVMVDYDTYKIHNYDARKLKKYFMSFWNAVDLRYQAISDPYIKVKVAGIVIAKSQQATPYLQNNIVDGNGIDSIQALADYGKYLYNEHRLPGYDVAFMITKMDMCTKKGNWGPCNRVTAGYAYVGGACSISKYFHKINSVGLIEDSGGFSGIIVAAHELGHLLGSVHDGSPPAAYLGGPGARHCSWNDGYIMSDMRRDYRGLKWSHCTTEQFAHFARDRRSQCLKNYPSESSDLPQPNTLPGKLISLDAQCKKDRGTSACFKNDRVCTELYCFAPSSGYCVSYRPAAEGSPCGRGMHCINGQCQPQGFYY